VPLNPLDETLDELDRQDTRRRQQTPANPFLETLDAMDDDRRRRLEIAGRAASTQSPDRAAEVKRLSERTGLPSEFIDRNFDDIRKRAKEVDTPYAKMLRESPALATFLENPTNAAIAQDDLPQLSVLDRSLRVGRNLVGAAGAGLARFAEGAFGFLRQQSEAALANPNIAGPGSPIVANVLAHPKVAEYAEAWARASSHLADRMRGKQEGAGFVESSIYSGIESIGLMVPGAALSVAGGGTPVLLGAMGATTSGLSYQEARSQGVDPGKANLYAALDGAIEVATEYLPAVTLMKYVKGESKFTKWLVETLRAEVPGEEIATALQDLNAWATLPANKDRTFTDYLEERPSAAAQTLISTLAMVAVTAGAGHGTRRMIEKLGGVAQESKTFQRSPEAVAEFVTKAAEEGATTFYQDVTEWKTYWETQGIDPRAKATEVTGDPQAFDNAVALGQELAIPIARYAVTLAGTEHNEHFKETMRIDAGETNGAQADERVAAMLSDGYVAPTEGTPGPALDERLTAIRTDLVAQLRKAGYDATAAATNVDVVMKAANLALRAGFDPVKTIERYGLKVKREAMEPTAPPQAAPAGSAGTAPAGTGDAPTGVRTEGTAAGEAAPQAIVESVEGAAAGAPASSPSVADEIAAGLKSPAAAATLTADGQAQDGGDTGSAGAPGDTGGGNNVSRPASQSVAPAADGAVDATSEAAGRPTRGAQQVPSSWRPYFGLLHDDATANGYRGDVDTLADQFLTVLTDAERVADDLNAPDDSQYRAGDLLAAIAKLGGFGIEAEGSAGMRGELEHVLESLTRQGIGVNRRTGRAMPKQFRQVGKVPGGQPNQYVVRRKGGHPVDTILELLREDPRFENAWESLSDMLQEVADAVAIETGQMKPKGTGRYTVEGVLQGVYDVRPGSTWWRDPATNATPFAGAALEILGGDVADGAQNNASGESAASIEAINRQRSMQARGETFVVYGRDGVRRPLIGVDAVDYVAQAGETYGIEGPDGFRVLDDRGGAAPVASLNLLEPTTFEAEMDEAGVVYDLDDTSFDFTEFEQRDPDIPRVELVDSLPDRYEQIIPDEQMTPRMREIAREQREKFEAEFPEGSPQRADWQALYDLTNDPRWDGGIDPAWFPNLTFGRDGEVRARKAGDLPPTLLALQFGDMAARGVNSVLEGHKLAMQIRDAAEDEGPGGAGGASNWPEVKIVNTESGVVIGYIAYNGRMWRKPPAVAKPWDEMDPRGAGDVDTLSTGEQQPRLPGAEQVRDQEVQQPQLGTAKDEFSLTPPKVKPPKQRTLFQGLTQADVDAFVADVRAKTGPDLLALDLYVMNSGAIELSTLAISRGAARAGLGSSVMQAVTKFADAHGVRLELYLAESGYTPVRGSASTSSRTRLEGFYKRFGFVANEGRRKDYSTRADMYREPTVRATEKGLTLPGPAQDLGALDTPAFRAWFRQSKVVDGHGQPLVVYHGTARGDRVGNRFRKGRATSGPMPFFTDTRPIAESYSTKKADTSLEQPDDYAGWFKFKPAGSRSEVDLDRAWYFLSAEQKATVIERLPTVGYENPDTGEGRIVAGTESIAGKDHIAFLLEREARGNGLKAAKELWLNSGSLFNDEAAFLDVLEGLGVGGLFRFDSPYATQPKVFEVYLSIQNPLVTDAIPEAVVTALEKRSRRQRQKTEHGADLWDKDTRDPQHWIAQLKEDRAKGVNSFVWTSIPDWVTDTLRTFGYDGIKDTGGKMGGEGHTVWIPFAPQQIKATENRGTFSAATSNILRQKKRGAIRFGADRQMLISLFDGANLSTFLHEAGHFYLEVFGDVVDALRALDPPTLNESQRKLLADYDLLLKHLGVESRDEIDTSHHEQFARTFEAYLMEGKAPSEALRPAFARIRSWMLDIYQSLKALRVNLTPEVRGVFDRMLATDAEIFQVEQAEKVQPMFLTAEQAGKTEAEFALYREDVEAASRVARENLEAKVLGELRREQKREWKAQRAEIETAVRAEVEAMPVYRAIVAMQRGTTPAGEPLLEGLEVHPLKLNKQALVERFGKDRLKRLPRPYLYETDGQYDPEVVADMFDFTSADEMLAAIENAAPMAEKIQFETSRRMLAEHGSVLLDGRLHERAQAAVANDRRDAVIRSEMLALRKLEAKAQPFVEASAEALAQERKERAYERRWFEAETKLAIAIAKGAKQVEIDALRAQIRTLKRHIRGGRRQLQENLPTDAAMREAARRIITRVKVRNLKPQTYWHASRKAAQLAIEAAAQTNYARAIELKTQELLNLALFRLSSEAVEEVQTRVQKAKGLTKGAARSRIGLAGGGLLDQIEGILERFAFVPASNKTRAGLQNWIAEQMGESQPVNLPDEITDEQLRGDYRDLTYEQFLGVTDGLTHLLHLVGIRNRAIKYGKERELNDVADTIADSIAEHAKRRTKTPIETRLAGEQFKRGLAGFNAWQRKLSSLAREMDGGIDGGPMWEYFVRPANESADTENVEMEKAATAFIEAIGGFSPSDLIAMNQKVYVPEINDSITRAGMIMVALNWGNEGNRQRMTSGYQWTTEQAQAVLDRLEAADWRFVKATWAQVNSYKQAIIDKQTRVYGVAPEMVEPTPFNTRFGPMPGGYFPIKWDSESDPKAFGEQVEQIAQQMMAGAVTNATTRRGFTQARKARVTGRRVQLDFTVIWQHVTEVIHDLTHHEMLIDVNRLLRHPRISTAIREHYGMPVYRELQAAFRDIAAGEIPAQHQGDRALRWTLSGTSIARMGWNLMTSLVQPLGFTVATTRRVGPMWVARGAARFLGDAVRMENTVKWIWEQSPMMRLRHKTFSREIVEVKGKLQPRGSYVLASLGQKVAGNAGARAGFAVASKFAALEETYFYLIGKMQMVADTLAWLGEYEKASANKSNDDARVIALADQAVLDTQGSGMTKDLARSMRDPKFKLFTQFMGYFNVIHNQAAEATGTTRFKDPLQVGRLATDLLILYTVPMLLEEMIRSAVRGDDDKDKDGYLLWFAKNQASYLMSTVVGLRELSGLPKGFRYTGPAGTGVVGDIGNLAVQIGQWELDEELLVNLNKVGGVLFHYPATGVERQVRSAIALGDAGVGEALAALAGRKAKKD
jgi:GNAT superfamily N-acetyltransferase